MAKKKAAAASGPSFEAALARLEEIVHELEEADLPLERSLAVFEEGVRLSRLLHQRLGEAERKVEILLRNEEGEKVPVPFAGGADATAPPVSHEGEDDDEEGEGPDGGGQRALPF